jgi:hypothetical protein
MRWLDILILTIFCAGLVVTELVAPTYFGVIVPLSLAGIVGYV